MRLVLRPLMVVLLTLLAGTVHSAERNDASSSSVEVAENAGAAARQAVGMTGGRVLDVQKRFFGERAMYVVKVLLHDGRVKVVELEANPTSGPDFMER